jgi:hypothetical protein
MEKLSICLTEWQARVVLEALNALEQKWQHVNATAQDEDDQEESANDLVELNIAKKYIAEAAVQLFGSSVVSSSRTLV